MSWPAPSPAGGSRKGGVSVEPDRTGISLLSTQAWAARLQNLPLLLSKALRQTLAISRALSSFPVEMTRWHTSASHLEKVSQPEQTQEASVSLPEPWNTAVGTGSDVEQSSQALRAAAFSFNKQSH